jgi:hypothetical protein
VQLAEKQQVTASGEIEDRVLHTWREHNRIELHHRHLAFDPSGDEEMPSLTVSTPEGTPSGRRDAVTDRVDPGGENRCCH